MPPKTPQLSDHDFFRMRLDAMIDGRHELVRLSKLIDLKRFEEPLGGLYDENRGRPALPTRLMAGLHLPKHLKDLSDEQVCAQWVEKKLTSRPSAASRSSATNCRSTAPR